MIPRDRRLPRDRTRRLGVTARRIALVMVALASLVVLVVALPMLASEDRPRGDYAPFGQCPLGNPATKLCLFTQTESGEFTVGAKAVPIGETITLQGGVHVLENKEKEIVKEEFIGAKDGETLSKTPQAVPGGLRRVVDPKLLSTGLRAMLNELIDNGTANVTATIELAAPASAIGIDIQDLVEGEGAAMSLPVRMKLSNVFLGNDCYIGSRTQPISLSLTTGTTDPPKPNKPIKGKVGKAKLRDEYDLTTIKGSSLVNNSFRAPQAEGCGGIHASLIDPAVNAELGLPAAAGHNTAILNGTLRDANALAVKASE
jgi:hypothetical protein